MKIAPAAFEVADPTKLDALLQQNAAAALEQIEMKGYISELAARGITNILKIGLAFCRKRI